MKGVSAMLEWKDKKILIVGTGISGIAAAKLLDKLARVVLYDANDKLMEAEVRKKLPEDFAGSIALGAMTEEVKQGLDYVVLSPAVPTDLPDVLDLKKRGVTILGEIELAYQYAKGDIVAITGTNGKTTTTALVGEIMRNYFESVHVVGNIGIPYTERAPLMTEDSVTVAEISSFQLETILEFHPKVSAILNITPDHLDRHHTMENYIAAKGDIAKNQTAEDVCVLNYEDAALQELAKGIKAQICWFSSARCLEKGLYTRDGHIYYNDGAKEIDVCAVEEMNIIGRHNHENAMTAIAMGIAMQVPMECIRKALREFVAVEHRIEYVTTKKGVKYYNNSKGTNPDASIQAVRAMTTPTVLIAGGYDKGSEYEEWIDCFEDKIKCLVLMGQTRDKIAEAARGRGFHDIVMVESMEEAVSFAAAHTKPGETVLLSPCCASWGMFKNYEERGNIFKTLVRALED